MNSYSRFSGPSLDTVQLQSAFSGSEEMQRMNSIRGHLQVVRGLWRTDDGYKTLMTTFKNFCDLESCPAKVKHAIHQLVNGYRDYVDVDFRRPDDKVTERYRALELYCSSEGYDFLYSVMSRTLRTKSVSEDHLLAVAVIMEFVTIEMYNLRMSQIGDCRYSNFQGVVYRGLSVSPHTLQVYEDILDRPELEQRGFSIPLGLLSSSIEPAVTQNFSNRERVQDIQMHWEIHIHACDPALLTAYRQRWPDSIVTTICAMPVGHVSEYGEKEILLRGAFFQLIAIEKRKVNGGTSAKLVTVMVNANRDHATEFSLDVGAKKEQREAFSLIVKASKYGACADLAKEYSISDAARYLHLQKQTVHDIQSQHMMKINVSGNAFTSGDSEPLIWVGGKLMEHYPRHYALRRQRWQNSIVSRDWATAKEILDSEYDWRRSDWYNVGFLFGATPIENGLTMLHELVKATPADVYDMADSNWKCLFMEAKSSQVWKTIRSEDEHTQTPTQYARGRCLQRISNELEPIFVCQIKQQAIDCLDREFHKFMDEVGGEYVNSSVFRKPQLSILKETGPTKIWVPVPLMYGGFLLHFTGAQLHITAFTVDHDRAGHKQFTLLLEVEACINLPKTKSTRHID